MAQNPLEVVEVFKNKSMTPGSPLTVDTNFPMDGLWHRMDLTFRLALTQTTGSGIFVNALPKFFKSISLSSGNTNFIRNVSSYPLYRLATFQNGGIAPQKTSENTTTATTYSMHLPILFADPLADFPNDTAIDARRHKTENFKLEILPGTIANWLNTVGDGAVVLSADCTIAVEKGNLPPIGDVKNGMPAAYREISQPGPIDPSSTPLMNFERNRDYFLRRVFVQAANGATLGTPWSNAYGTGTGTNTTLTDLYIESQVRRHMSQRPEQNIRWDNASVYGLSTPLTGEYLFDFIEKGSNRASFPTDPEVFTQLLLGWTNNTLSTSQISVCIDGMRKYPTA
jgi:hypothetical protein